MTPISTNIQPIQSRILDCPKYNILIITFLFHVTYIGLHTTITALVTLAFAGSIGMTFVILGCALPAYKVWWPFFVVLFYILAPIPTLIARRYTEDSGNNSNPCLELAIFITTGIVVSSFALPIVLARSPVLEPVIKWGACYLTLAGNVIVYLTLVGFFMTFDQDDSDYSVW